VVPLSLDALKILQRFPAAAREGSVIKGNAYMTLFPNVNAALIAAQELADSGLVTISQNGSLRLTADGAGAARDL
jgi:hypothetical protein